MAAAIREASAQFARKPAFTLGLPNGSQGGITFEETDRLSDQLAVYLREVAGFKAGDRVAIQMPNCLAYPIAVFGILKAGLVMVNTNPLYTTRKWCIIHGQRGRRVDRDRSIRAEGRGRAAEDVDQDRRGRDDFGSAAAIKRLMYSGAEIRGR